MILVVLEQNFVKCFLSKSVPATDIMDIRYSEYICIRTEKMVMNNELLRNYDQIDQNIHDLSQFNASDQRFCARFSTHTCENMLFLLCI